jgi:outer membrane protein insertion porin family
LLTAAQAELILPIPQKWRSRFRISAFYDIGGVFDTGGVTFFEQDGISKISYDFDASELKQSVGVAAEWLAPLGLFRFSYGFALNPQDSDGRRFGDEVEGFQFNIGGAF